MNRLIAAMREEAVDTERAGAGTDDLTVTSHVELRYCGQGHELPVALPDQPLTVRHKSTPVLRRNTNDLC